MCKVRREKGEQDSTPIIQSIKDVLNELRENLPASVKEKNFESKQDLIKAIE
jgi:Cu/Ag efflux pump CusA